jgi:hypothetical protein
MIQSPKKGKKETKGSSVIKGMKNKSEMNTPDCNKKKE